MLSWLCCLYITSVSLVRSPAILEQIMRVSSFISKPDADSTCWVGCNKNSDGYINARRCGTHQEDERCGPCLTFPTFLTFSCRLGASWPDCSNDKIKVWCIMVPKWTVIFQARRMDSQFSFWGILRPSQRFMDFGTLLSFCGVAKHTDIKVQGETTAIWVWADSMEGVWVDGFCQVASTWMLGSRVPYKNDAR